MVHNAKDNPFKRFIEDPRLVEGERRTRLLRETLLTKLKKKKKKTEKKNNVRKNLQLLLVSRMCHRIDYYYYKLNLTDIFVQSVRQVIS